MAHIRQRVVFSILVIATLALSYVMITRTGVQDPSSQINVFRFPGISSRLTNNAHGGFPQAREALFSADDVLKYQFDYEELDDPGLASFIYKRWINQPSKQPHRKDFYKKSHFSQQGQDAFVDKLLGQRENGFYVECGAQTGVLNSNSLFFELYRNWTGLLVEAIPNEFSKLLRNRRNAYSINACLNAENKTKLTKFAYSTNQFTIRGNLMPPKMQYALDIQCFPLYALMRSMKKTHIDFFSLDVEGAELPILKTIPFHKLRIDVLTLEYRYNTGNGRTDLQKTLEKLAKFREFFNGTKLYEEAAIIPIGASDEKGLDIMFKRKDLAHRG